MPLDRRERLAILPLDDLAAQPLLAAISETERLASWRLARRDGSLVGYAGVHPSVGRGYEFAAITAVVLGGVVLGGGRGWVVAAAAGAFALEALFTLLNFAGVPSTYRAAVQGIIIILAVAYAATTFRARRRGHRGESREVRPRDCGEDRRQPRHCEPR